MRGPSDPRRCVA